MPWKNENWMEYEHLLNIPDSSTLCSPTWYELIHIRILCTNMWKLLNESKEVAEVQWSRTKGHSGLGCLTKESPIQFALNLISSLCDKAWKVINQSEASKQQEYSRASWSKFNLWGFILYVSITFEVNPTSIWSRDVSKYLNKMDKWTYYWMNWQSDWQKMPYLTPPYHSVDIGLEIMRKTIQYIYLQMLITIKASKIYFFTVINISSSQRWQLASNWK